MVRAGENIGFVPSVFCIGITKCCDLRPNTPAMRSCSSRSSGPSRRVGSSPRSLAASTPRNDVADDPQQRRLRFDIKLMPSSVHGDADHRCPSRLCERRGMKASGRSGAWPVCLMTVEGAKSPILRIAEGCALAPRQPAPSHAAHSVTNPDRLTVIGIGCAGAPVTSSRHRVVPSSCCSSGAKPRLA
jgi:hypothetical protein